MNLASEYISKNYLRADTLPLSITKYMEEKKQSLHSYIMVYVEKINRNTYDILVSLSLTNLRILL